MDINKANKVLDNISSELSSLTLFKLLLVYENLQNTIVHHKERLRKLKERKSEIEAKIFIEINEDKNIKTSVKKAVFDLTKTKNTEYNDVSNEYNDLRNLIEKIENLLKIIDKKYKLIEPAFHSNGVLTYAELEREYNR